MGPVLFSIVIDDLDDERECTLSRFANDTNLGVADKPDSCDAIQRALNRLEKWTERNLIKFSKGKCKDLPLERSSLMHKYMLGANWLERSFAEKDLGVLVGTKLNVSQHGALVVKSSGILACIRVLSAS